MTMTQLGLSQSHHSGIETCALLLAFYDNFERRNRTIVGLKQVLVVLDSAHEARRNRTIVGLKPRGGDFLNSNVRWSQSHHSGIET